MKQMKPQLSSFNVFSFKTEAEMIVWIKFWEKHADDYFKRFSPFGLLKVTFNQVWNKKTSLKHLRILNMKVPKHLKKSKKKRKHGERTLVMTINFHL